MKPVKVTICTGTTCHLMGASQFHTLKDHLDDDVRPYVEIEGSHCLGFCNSKDLGQAPFVLLNGDPVAKATLPKLVRWVEKMVREEPFSDGERPEMR